MQHYVRIVVGLLLLSVVAGLAALHYPPLRAEATPPTFSKAFAATSIPVNGSTTLSFFISNPNPVPMTGISFTDILPAGLVISTPNGLVNGCGGSITATAGSSTISLSAGMLAAAPASCTIVISVTGTIPGSWTNTSGPISSAVPIESGGVASDSITVASPAGSIFVLAAPNVLPCGGGTSTITAAAVDAFGQPAPGAFNFSFATDAGLLTQTGPNTAVLGIFPGIGSATVTASLPNLSGSTTVVVRCAGGVAAVVVTADPNVVKCGGSSLITAAARDANGHVVDGVGFHFATDTGGLLSGPPNTANAINNSAILTLLPGMPSSTVRVSVGTLIGTVEGTITVQQFCPQTAPAGIKLTPAANAIACQGSAFIGVTVRDNNGQVPADGTEVTFMATAGSVTPATASTRNGALNVTYKADVNTAGTVLITAASGASFGSTTLAACVAGGTGAEGSIRPPSTGDGGLLP